MQGRGVHGGAVGREVGARLVEDARLADQRMLDLIQVQALSQQGGERLLPGAAEQSADLLDRFERAVVDDQFAVLAAGPVDAGFDEQLLVAIGHADAVAKADQLFQQPALPAAGAGEVEGEVATHLLGQTLLGVAPGGAFAQRHQAGRDERTDPGPMSTRRVLLSCRGSLVCEVGIAMSIRRGFCYRSTAATY